MASTSRRGLMVVLSAPSATGKTTLARRLVEEDDNLEFSVSATTRPRRSGEVDGRDMHFVDSGEFACMIDRSELLEHATVFGNAYGTPRAPVEAALASGRDIVSDIDCQGARQLRASMGADVVLVFVLPPSAAELERRLVARGADAPDVMRRRMTDALTELGQWESFDYVIVNRDLDESLDSLRAILSAERMRRDRQIMLSEVVRTMCQELAEG